MNQHDLILRRKIGWCAICGSPILDYSDYPLKAAHAWTPCNWKPGASS